MKFSASITINASQQKIWNILINAASYPEWDPGMLRIEGKIAAGKEVKFFTKVSPKRAFKVKVTKFIPGQKLAFTSGMPFGLFTSKRTHTLSAGKDGGTEFHTEEVFSGPLLSMIGKKLPDLNENFREFAEGLKKRAEG